MSTLAFVKKEIALRQNLVGEGFLNTPPKDKGERFTIVGELDFAEGFEYKRIYIFSQIVIGKGWEFEDEVEYHIVDPEAIDQTEINKRRTCTQVCNSTTIMRNGKQINHAKFCFPIDYQLLVSVEKGDNFHPPAFIFQVNSMDSWNRHRIEGYGFVHFPLQPGFHKLKCTTWKPVGNLYSKIHSYFLGGSTRIIQLENIMRTNYLDEMGHKDIVNRFGLETITSGLISLKLNVAIQSHDIKAKERKMFRDAKHKEDMRTKKQINEEILLKVKQETEIMGAGPSMIETSDQQVISRFGYSVTNK